jgi:hypothetical protein
MKVDHNDSRSFAVIFTKDELIRSLQHETRILLHLAGKVDPAALNFRPTPEQRSTLELLQYLTIMAPIQLRAISAGGVDMDQWSTDWRTQEAIARERDLAAVQAAIAAQQALFVEILGPCNDKDFRVPMEMFGHKQSRGAWIVNLTLCGFAAYRMQLFLYLKACGRIELTTLDLWAGAGGS